MKDTDFKELSPRVQALKEEILSAKPCIEAERAVIVTESFKETEDKPMILRKALALKKILEEIPIAIRDRELIIGTMTKNPRSAQVFPEFSNQWLVNEFDEIGKRKSDSYMISEETKKTLLSCFSYWRGKTVNELATGYLEPETRDAMNANTFTVGNYWFNGLGHYVVDYEKVLTKGIRGLREEVEQQMATASKADPSYMEHMKFWEALLITFDGAVTYARRYSALAKELAEKEKNPERRAELENLAEICAKVPEYPAETFYEAMQSFWIIQLVISLESNGHAISPGRFDQYMYPFYRKDAAEGKISHEFAQELINCLWVKFNDLSKIRDYVTTLAFSGYGMFQNLIVGGQTRDGRDAANDVTFMCIDATGEVKLPQPSFSARVWTGATQKYLRHTARLTRLGLGFPAFYNDEVIIASLVSRGIALEDARDYAIVGCVEPQAVAKTDGWFDAAFFNLARVLEITLHNGKADGKQIGPVTGDLEDFKNIEEIIAAYKKQIAYFVNQMVLADNCVDLAHRKRAPLPFVSSLMDDCIAVGKSIQEGGAHYRSSGPLGVGVANVGDAFMAIKELVFDKKMLSLRDLKKALETDFGKQCDDEFSKKKYEKIRLMLINRAPKYGNDIDEVDYYTREGAQIYCKEVEKYTNLRGGKFLPALYPVSNNVHLGDQVGATPDGRYSHSPIADGVSPSRGMDVKGPTAAASSVAKLDHMIATSGTLYNQKFSPQALKGDSGLDHLISLITAFFAKKGMHIQFNVVDKDTLLKAQQHPEEYRDLIVRVAGYSAQFIILDKDVQNDIIARTEQEF